MTMREVTACIPAFFLLTLVQLIGALYGAAAGALAAAAVGVAASFAPRWFALSRDGCLAVTILAVSTSACGVLLPLSSAPPKWGMLLFPAIAGSMAAVISLSRAGTSQRCACCNRPVKGGSFDCPRCGQTVCDRSCWNFQSSRCRSCEERHVPILSSDAGWWDRNLGRRVRQGRCQVCHTSAAETDLRVCQQCGRPACRACWDASNGQCTHCLWVVRELPASLQKFVLRYESPVRATRRTQRIPRSRSG